MLLIYSYYLFVFIALAAGSGHFIKYIVFLLMFEILVLRCFIFCSPLNLFYCLFKFVLCYKLPHLASRIIDDN